MASKVGLTISVLSFSTATILLNSAIADNSPQTPSVTSSITSSLNSKLDKKATPHKKEEEHNSIITQKKDSASTRLYKESHGGDASRISLGPYLDKGSNFDGISGLMISLPSVKKAAQLLLNQYKMDEELRKGGLAAPTMPRVIFSGKIGGQIPYAIGYTNPEDAIQVNSAAQLVTYVQINEWVSALTLLDYDPNELKNGSYFITNRASITIGNLHYTPFYINVGRVYLPFGGNFSTWMLTAPVTQGLARTLVRAATLGYQQVANNRLYAVAYVFQGLIGIDHDNKTNACDRRNNTWGAALGYRFTNNNSITGEIGASYISDLSHSQSIQTSVFLEKTTPIQHPVPAYDVHAKIMIEPVSLSAEYVGALKSFDSADINFADHGARPTALHGEISCEIKGTQHPGVFGVGYGQTTEAFNIGLPKERYTLFYVISPWRNTLLGFEYHRDINYSASAISKGPNPTPNSLLENIGKQDNVFIADFSLFF